MIQFTHTIFYVEDILATLSFFEKAFGIKPKFVHESNMYAELETGQVALAFASEKLGKMNLQDGFLKNNAANAPQACEICLTASDPDKYYDRSIASGAISISPPKKKPWGQVVGYVRDPSGILIEIAGPIPN